MIQNYFEIEFLNPIHKSKLMEINQLSSCNYWTKYKFFNYYRKTLLEAGEGI